MKWKIWLVALLWVWIAVLALPDYQMRVVICDVGQGDAILIQRGTSQLLVDGGPGERVLECLAKHMPFYDRQIEVVVATHPEADHIAGIASVAERYQIVHFIEPVVGKQTKIYDRVMRLVGEGEMKVSKVYAGDLIRLGKIKFRVVWPEKDWVDRYAQSPEVNQFSIGGIVEYGEFKIMLTGDADMMIQTEELANGRLVPVDVVKVPHHGSKTGMTVEWLEALTPRLAVISVGKNSFGHPTKEAMDILEDVGAEILRTDIEGDILIETNGKTWEVK